MQHLWEGLKFYLCLSKKLSTTWFFSFYIVSLIYHLEKYAYIRVYLFLQGSVHFFQSPYTNSSFKGYLPIKHYLFCQRPDCSLYHSCKSENNCSATINSSYFPSVCIGGSLQTNLFCNNMKKKRPQKVDWTVCEYRNGSLSRPPT